MFKVDIGSSLKVRYFRGVFIYIVFFNIDIYLVSKVLLLVLCSDEEYWGFKIRFFFFKVILLVSKVEILSEGFLYLVFFLLRE